MAWPKGPTISVPQVDRATPPRTPPRNGAEMVEKEEAGRTGVLMIAAEEKAGVL